ncbi:MAG: Uncharacterized protein FD140_307 [Limisphaerales bacterium]|nr:MAG: Uncharacterized protein FD140_307 [Limisphaerales bacterium]
MNPHESAPVPPATEATALPLPSDAVVFPPTLPLVMSTEDNPGRADLLVGLTASLANEAAQQRGPTEAAETPPPPLPPVPLEDLWQRILARLRRLPLAPAGKWLLTVNPFYLASAVMMLYGLYLVSVDTQLLGQETSQLAFNFSSLQLYECLLVVTAVVLARRRIWYDSTLLVIFENLFAVVPFILISQASFISADWKWAACAAAVALPLARFTILHRRLPELNLPLNVLALGACLLLVNLAFPLLYREVIEHDNDWWLAIARQFWLGLLPLPMLALNCFPPLANRGDGPAGWARWAFIFPALWLGATVAHLHSIAYVDGQKFSPHLASPLLWAFAWTLRNKVTEVMPFLAPAWRNRLLILPLLATLPALGAKDTAVFLVLTLLNGVVLTRLALRHRDEPWFEPLAVASSFALLAGLPEFLGNAYIPEFSRGKAVQLALAGFALLQATRSARIKHGLLGALLVGLGTPVLFTRLDYVGPFALQNALLYLLLHSFRWRDTQVCSAHAIRFAVALMWLPHSVVWLRIAGPAAASTIALGALLVLAFSVLFHLLDSPPPKLVVGLALANFAFVPANWTFEALRITPIGYLVVLVSFLLFGAGTALALLRARWLSPKAPPDLATG